MYGYSSILPVKELKLLLWMWQEAFANITVFSHMVPLVVVGDVVKPQDNAPVDGRAAAGHTAGEVPSMVKLPTCSLGQWEWLQPFHDKNRVFPDSVDVNAFEVSPADERPRFERVIRESFPQLCREGTCSSHPRTKVGEL